MNNIFRYNFVSAANDDNWSYTNFSSSQTSESELPECNDNEINSNSKVSLIELFMNSIVILFILEIFLEQSETSSSSYSLCSNVQRKEISMDATCWTSRKFYEGNGSCKLL